MVIPTWVGTWLLIRENFALFKFYFEKYFFIGTEFLHKIAVHAVGKLPTTSTPRVLVSENITEISSIAAKLKNRGMHAGNLQSQK